MKKPLRIAGIALGVLISLCAFFYLLLTNLYSGRFGLGVWVNDIYATGLTAEEVSRLLDGSQSDEGLPEVIVLKDREGRSLVIPTESLHFYSSYRVAVKDLLNHQNPLTWFQGLSGGVHLEARPDRSFNLTALEKAMDEWEIFSEDFEEDTRIEKTSSGYQLILQTAEIPDKSGMLKYASEQITAGEALVNLDTPECYRVLEITDGTDSLVKTWNAIEKTRLPALTYVIGDEKIRLDAAVTDDWLLTADELKSIRSANVSTVRGTGRAAADKSTALDEDSLFLIGDEEGTLPDDVREVNGFAQSADGQLIIKESEIDAFVDGLCEQYDTLGRDRNFTTVDGRVIRVPGGTYGNAINAAEEKAWLKEAVRTHASTEHVPATKNSDMQLGETDIGNTYVEVDIGKQTLYYVLDGKVDTEIQVVTGCKARHNDTPPGVYYIYYMQPNRTLVGENYQSFVHYWMAFYKAYGLHDATWRGSFGGEIYLTNGSHGCVNLPYAEAGPLYRKLSVGTPVIVHE